MSTISPLRASFTAQKRNNSINNRFTILSQKSPNVDSPKLNDENMDRTQKMDNSNDLKMKLDILLKNNSQLLNQNAQLSELVNSLRIQLDIRTRREESQFSKINQELANAILQMKSQQQNHQSQLERLLSQISTLHDQCHQLEIEKANEIRRHQEAHQREMVQQIVQIKRSQDDGKSLMDLQIAKLRQSLQMKDFQYESLKTQLKSQTEQLKTQINILQSQLQHQRKLKQLEINETSRRSKDDMRSALKHLQLQKNVEIRQYENKIIKLKKDLSNKDREIETQAKKITGQNEEVYLQLSSLKKDKQYLLEQIQTLTQTAQQKIVKEKERISQLAELQKENMQNLYKNEKESLQGQKEKLIRLCEEKSGEIKRLYDTMKKIKDTAEIQRLQLKSIIQGLRAKLKEIQRANMEECELLKIKMAQLHQTDVSNLSRFYENEVASLKLELNIVKQAHDSDREKLYNLLAQNDELRKNFEVEIAKQKAKVQDMKVKFAAARLQFKEQITSLGTKMQLTSQSLVRQTDQKQRGTEFFQAQKRKFYKIIEDKDREIQSIHETMQRIKKINDEQIAQQKSQINMLRESLIAKDQQFKQFKATLEQQYERRSLKLIQQTKEHNPDEQLQKELHEVKGKLTELQKDNFKKQKDIEFLQRENKSLAGELGLKSGYIQTIQMQSCAAIEDEKEKIRVLMGKNEVSMKDYYQSKLVSKDQDNQNLKRQLKQKQTDLKNVVSKYHQLQKKLRDLLEAQQKLTDFQNKVVNLGLDQNLIKNMAELFSRQAKQ